LKVPPLPSLIAFTLAASASAAAQSAPASHAIVVGVARDSLRGNGGALAGGYVQLLPGGRQVRTDSAGHFRFDSIRAGERYSLHLMHAALDTIGVAVVSPEFAVRAGDTVHVDLAVPSAERLLHILCTPGMLTRGPSALVGFIRHPESGAPLDSVSVSLVYDEAPISIVKWPVNRVAFSGSSGHYAICGLPERMSGRVRLTHHSVASGDIPVSLDSAAPLTLRSMALAPAGRRVSESAGVVHIVVGEGRLEGRVVDRLGLPVREARVQVDGTPAATITGADGAFRLDSVPLGTQTLSVRKIGYVFVERAIEVDRYLTPAVTIALADVVPTLAPVVSVSQRERDLDATGFQRRRTQGLGFFLEGDQIDRAPPVLGEALRMVPGLRVGYDAQNQRSQKTMVMPSRNESRGCVRYVVDGVYWQEIGGDIERFIRPQDLEALEMYNPATVPGEFAAASRGRCAVLVLWTRHTIRPAKQR
jgi:hypothetical protein